MQKTAVQNLIDYLGKTYIFVDNGQTRQEFKKALQEKRENIETAFNEGFEQDNWGKLGKEYYSQTFKND